MNEKFQKAKSLEEIIRSTDNVNSVIEYLMEGNDYSTLDEANAFLEQIQDKWNVTPRRELFEHSPEETAILLYNQPKQKLDETKLYTDLSSCDANIEKAPLYQNWVRLLDYISSNEVHATARGNLNRKAVSELKETLEMEKIRAEYSDSIRNEDDWEELRLLRACAEFKHMIKRSKGKWIVTKKCLNMLNNDHKGATYTALFDAWFNYLNWGCIYRREILEKIDFQKNRYFILSAILRCASDWMNYGDFLHILHYDFLRFEIENEESELSGSLRVLDLEFLYHYPLFKYLERMNIIEISYIKDENRYFETPDKLRVTDLGKHFIQFINHP